MYSKKLLIIGALPHDNKSETYGGTTVLMKNLVDFLECQNSCEFIIVRANRFLKVGSSLLNFLYVLCKVIIKLPSSDIIMVNVSVNGAFILSPVLFIFTKLLRKKFVFRMFGGDLIELLKTKNSILLKIFNLTVMKSDIIFVETFRIIKFLKNRTTKTSWFPNVRRIESKIIIESKYNKRFVFISHINRSKGIVEIIHAFKELDESYIIDVYGPIKDDVLDSLELPENFNYKGVLEPEIVLETINRYDVLLLPTYWRGEGYPGIIIEAFSQGKPVISTNWNSIPELVDSKSGILIEPKNYKELKKAITHFNSDNYSLYSYNALQKSNKFNSDIVNKRIINEIANIKN